MLANLRSHKLHRTLGNWQARTGASLILIGKGLNHKDQAATAIHARLDLDPMRQSVDRAAPAIFEAAGIKKAATVFPSAKRKPKQASEWSKNYCSKIICRLICYALQCYPLHDTQTMIRTFKHKGLDRFFTKGDHRGIPVQSAARIERMLDRLDASVGPGDMDVPGYRFHPLKGERAGEYAVSVSGNWRITFAFDSEDAIDVNLEDYH